MAENQDAQDDFAKNVFKGLINKARQHLQRGGQKLEEGANEQTDAHYRDASKIIDQLSQSPQLWTWLTPQERNQYEGLQHKIKMGKMSNSDWQLYKQLGNKGAGTKE